MATSPDDQPDLGQKLDLLIALTRMGVRDQLDRELAAIREDPVQHAILQETGDWVPAGKLKDAVLKKSKQSRRTVESRIAELVSRGGLQRQGAGASVSYRNAGLFEV